MHRLLLTVMGVGLASAALASTAWAAGDAAAGKAAAASCGMCHGQSGEGTQMGPKLAGLDTAKFTLAMNDYKAGKGENAMMKTLAVQLSDQDIANLAAYYASLK